MDCSLPGSSGHGLLKARILEWVPIPSSRVSSWPRNRTQVSCVAGRFFTDWAMRETSNNYFPGQNTGVGSHCLLQRIFPTQGSNPNLWHCRRILYNLNHQGSPLCNVPELKINTYASLLAQSCNAGDRGSIPGSGRSPGEGNGSPLQYSSLENPMDGGAW